jgi:hypothetical protein
MSKARELADLGSVTTRLDEVGNTDGALSNRNLIINGAMQVAQRGTSSTASGYQVLDRIFINHSGGAATVSQEEATFGNEVLGEFKNWMKFDATTGDNYLGFQTRLEDVRSLKEGTATFSFYAKGTNPNSGSYVVGLQRLPAGASGSTLDTPLDSTVTITSTWTRYTFTFAVPALGDSVTETANSQLYLYVAQQGTDTSTDAWELNITGMQLEQGDTATPFEHRSYSDELQRCQRYYQTASMGSMGVGQAYTTGAWNYKDIRMFAEMRTAPSLSYTGGIDGNWQSSSSAYGVTAKSKSHCHLYAKSNSSYADIYIGGGGIVFYMDAEL